MRFDTEMEIGRNNTDIWKYNAKKICEIRITANQIAGLGQ